MGYTIDGREVPINRLDKVLYGDAGVTKAHVVRHVLACSDRMLPHLEDRPLAMRRWPDGPSGQGFFQKSPAQHFPGWVPVATLANKQGGTKQRVLVNDRATLAYLAGQAVLEFHVWTSTARRPERPDWIVIDLDPSLEGSAGWEQARQAARRLLGVADEIGVPAYPMLTGSRGVHVLVPVEPVTEREHVEAFANQLADVLVQRHPDTYTRSLAKQARGDRLFIDTLRNRRSQTSICPYSPRAEPGAPVATPIAREELADTELGPDRFTIQGFEQRLAEPDPWQGWRDQAVRIEG
jgi:bifunctional non-homologous end joining protein LigD